MFLGLIAKKKSNPTLNTSEHIELQSNQTKNQPNSNEHVYEEIVDYYDKSIRIENETLSNRKKVVRFGTNTNTLPSTSSSSPSILMPILRIDPKLNNSSIVFSASASISSASSASSSASSSSCGIYTNNSILSNNSSSNSNYSAVFNQMVEDFFQQSTLNRNKHETKNKKLPKKKKKSSTDLSSSISSSSTSNSSPNNSTLMNSANLKPKSDSKCCCNCNCNSKTDDKLDKLSYRVTNLTLEDLKKRQKLIFSQQKINNSLFSNNQI